MIRGKLDLVRKTTLLGWIWDSDRPDHHLSFQLIINDHCVGEYRANQPRSDLRKQAIGRGDHAFSIELDPQWLHPGSNTLEVGVGTGKIRVIASLRFVQDTGVQEIKQDRLSASKKSSGRVVLNSSGGVIRGRIEQVRSGVLHGWLWKTDTDDPVHFRLLVNRKPVTDRVADVRRKDLVKAGVGNGQHGFRIAVHNDWLEKGLNTFNLQVLPELQELPDALTLTLESSLSTAQGQPTPSTKPIEHEAGHSASALALRAPQAGSVEDRLTSPTAAPNSEQSRTGDSLSGEGIMPDLKIEQAVKQSAHRSSHPEVGDALASPTGHPLKKDRSPTSTPAKEDLRPHRILNTGVSVPDPHPEILAPKIPPIATSSKEGISSLSPRDIAGHMRSWSTKRLIAFQATYEKDVLLERAKDLFRQKKWAELGEIILTSKGDRRGRPELDTLVGRALLQAGQVDQAVEVLVRAAQSVKDAGSTNFYAAVACARGGDLETAIKYGRIALAAEPNNKQYLIDHSTYCRRLASKMEASSSERGKLILESVQGYRHAISLDDKRVSFCLLNIGRCYLDLEKFDEAITALKTLSEQEPNHVDCLILLSQALLASNRIKEALQIAERVVTLDPLKQGPRSQLRTLQGLVDDNATRVQSFAVVSWIDSTRVVSVSCNTSFSGENLPNQLPAQPLVLADYDTSTLTILASLSADWLVLHRGPVDAMLLDPEFLQRVHSYAFAWAGRLTGECRGTHVEFWRKDLILRLAESGQVSSIGSLEEDIHAFGALVATVDADRPKHVAVSSIEEATCTGLGPVIAMSRHGMVKFGGGEHFLQSMVEHYTDMGYDPILVGTRPERIGEEGWITNYRYAFIEATPSAMRAFFIRVKPRFVHVLSGLGFQVAEALEFFNIPFIYGVHYWRDCLGVPEGSHNFFRNHDREPIAKPAFRFVLEKAATVYTNSEFTRSVLEEAFSVRTPVVFSLPQDAQASPLEMPEPMVPGVLSTGPTDYILLVNAKTDKGFGLIIEVAKGLPEIRFLAIASQSERQDAEIAVLSAGITNLSIMNHTDRMDEVYRGARAVAVPSYRFVETFSRVCIEAQRFGKPVLGSDVGNVPFLLRESGLILSEDPEVWKSAISRIFSDQEYYSSLCTAAQDNSTFYHYGLQKKAIAGVISGVRENMLIGVGSGIGNMLHVAPMIRNIARRSGRRVDLVVTEDHRSSLFLLQNDEYVNSVFPIRQDVLRRAYHTVFITHSFGSSRLPFSGKHVLYARDWVSFEPAGPFHETIYNLEAAAAVLKIPYEETDIRSYFVGNYRYRRPGGAVRVGFHGGSKDGFWKSKRWPGFEALADRLQKRGMEVASFGTPEEYVRNTVDLTGGTIEEMVKRMLDMSYFISNDSGVMNLANALGIPVLGLFGPTNPLTRGPIGAKSRWVQVQKPCAPCEITASGRDTFLSGLCTCIADLTVDAVDAALVEQMKEFEILV